MTQLKVTSTSYPANQNLLDHQEDPYLKIPFPSRDQRYTTLPEILAAVEDQKEPDLWFEV